jgi:hypothetical protein
VCLILATFGIGILSSLWPYILYCHWDLQKYALTFFTSELTEACGEYRNACMKQTVRYRANSFFWFPNIRIVYTCVIFLLLAPCSRHILLDLSCLRIVRIMNFFITWLSLSYCYFIALGSEYWSHYPVLKHSWDGPGFARSNETCSGGIMDPDILFGSSVSGCTLTPIQSGGDATGTNLRAAIFAIWHLTESRLTTINTSHSQMTSNQTRVSLPSFVRCFSSTLWTYLLVNSLW